MTKATLGSIEITLSEDTIEMIALRVAEHLKPYLLGNVHSEDELLTVDEAAALLKRDKNTVYELVNNSKHGLSTFPYLKQGRRLRFSKRALFQWNTENGNCPKG